MKRLTLIIVALAGAVVAVAQSVPKAGSSGWPWDISTALVPGSQAYATANATALNKYLATAGSYTVGKPGTYYVNKEILVGSGVTLTAQYGQVTIAQADGFAGYVLRNKDGFNGNSDITVDGLVLDQRAVAATPRKARSAPPVNNASFGTGAWTGNTLFLRCKNLRLRNLWLKDWSGNGLIIAGGQRIDIDGVFLDGDNAGAYVANDGIHVMGDGAIGASAPNVPLEWVRINNVWVNPATGRGITDVTVQLLGVEYYSWRFTEGDGRKIAISNVFAPNAKKGVVRIVTQKAGSGGTQRVFSDISVNNVFSASTDPTVPAFESFDDAGDAAASGVKTTGGTVVNGLTVSNVFHTGTGYVMSLTASASDLTAAGLSNATFRNICQLGARTAYPRVLLAGVLTNAVIEDMTETNVGTTYGLINLTGANKINSLTLNRCGSTVAATLMGAPWNSLAANCYINRLTLNECFQTGAQWMIDGRWQTSGTPAKVIFRGCRTESGASGFLQSREGLADVLFTGNIANSGTSKIIRVPSGTVNFTTSANRREGALNNNTPGNGSPLDNAGSGTINVDTGS